MPEEFYDIDTSKVDNILNYDFKSKFRTVKPKFTNDKWGFYIQTEEDGKNVFEMNKINFNHSYTIFSKIPALLSLDNKISPLYLYSWFTSTKKVDFGATNGKKHHVDCVVITPVKKSSKTSDIIKQTILNMNSKSPNLNNYDMNDFFPVNNTIYGGWISGRLNYSKPPDDKDKKDLDNLIEKVGTRINIISESDDLTITENDLQKLIKNNSAFSSDRQKLDTNYMKKINEGWLYKKESSSGWGFSMNQSGGQRKDTKDDFVIDCSPVDLNQNGEEIEMDDNIGKVPSPEEQFEKLMKNPFIMIIFGFFIIGIFVKGVQYLFKFAKDNNVVGRMKQGMGNIKEKFKRNKHGKDTAAAITGNTGVKTGVKRVEPKGVVVDHSRSDTSVKIPKGQNPNQENRPLLPKGERSNEGKASKRFKVKPGPNVSSDPLVK